MDQQQTDATGEDAPRVRRGWITTTVVGIVLATFLSDFSHEACTAVLPLYLGAIGLGPLALGLIEGIADFLVSLSKLAGGVIGHHVRRKRNLTALGYLMTALATSAIGLVQTAAAIPSLRSLAWVFRGVRGPLRDSLLSDAVPRTHYGRAFGLERAGDMLGAVSGPLLATLLVWAGLSFQSVILWAIVPGVLAAASLFFLTRERPAPVVEVERTESAPASGRFPRAFWLFLIGVFLFGMGDFSRTFLVYLAARALGEEGGASGTLSLAVLLYAGHNLISAVAAYLVGWWADRGSRFRLLLGGYGLGVATNVLLALLSGSLPWLIVAIVFSGLTLATEETLEKAVVAGQLPRERRSLGFGILACANAVGDMVSSLWVGALLQAGRPGWAFGGAAVCGLVGVVWLRWHSARLQRAEAELSAP